MMIRGIQNAIKKRVSSYEGANTNCHENTILQALPVFFFYLFCN